MMNIFLTGATGYVGGDVLYALVHSSNPKSKICCLVRDDKKAQQIHSAYPDIRTVLGDLDDDVLIRREAAASDIVLPPDFASTGHAASAKAIAEGLVSRAKKSNSPGYWIQISGATCYAIDEIASKRFGYASDAIYDDLKDQDRILEILETNPKRVVENTVLAQSPSEVKTALIIGPLIYGAGRGPVNQRSIQAPEIAQATLKLGRNFTLNGGLNIWSNIHVQDLADLVILLVAAAQAGQDGLWNHEGVYNVDNGEMTFKDLCGIIAKEAQTQGYISKPDTASDPMVIDATKADALSGHASILWGTNARTKASKARKMLKWNPSGQPLAKTIPELVHSEMEKGKTKL